MILGDINKKNRIPAKGMLMDGDEKERSASRNNLFNALTLDGKSNRDLVIKSREIHAGDLEAIEKLYQDKNLSVKVRLKAKTEKSGQKEFESSWLEVNM